MAKHERIRPMPGRSVVSSMAVLVIGWATAAAPAQQASYYALDSPADQRQAMQQELSAMRDKLQVMQAELSALIAQTRQLRHGAGGEAAEPENGDAFDAESLDTVAGRLAGQSRRIEHQLQLLDEQRQRLDATQARVADEPPARLSFTDPPVDWREQPVQINPPDALVSRGADQSRYYVVSSPGAVAYSTHAVPRYTVGQPAVGSVVIEHVRYPRVWHGRPHWIDDRPHDRHWHHWYHHYPRWKLHHRYHYWRYYRRSGVWFGVDGDGFSIRINGKLGHRSTGVHRLHHRGIEHAQTGGSGLTVGWSTGR